MSNHAVDHLINIIEEETMIYKDLVEISKNKTDVIVKGKVNELETMTELEQSLIIKIGKLEAAREKIVENVCSLLDLDAQSATISQVLECVEAPQAEKLKQKKQDLLSVLDDIMHANEINEKLLKSSIDFIDFSINIMSNSNSDENNYGDSGKINESKKKTYFDVKL
ncbi:MAG: flagellar protein FlgN [Clostridium sp.]|nr:flagellar protein FlgN [Clostridium sp.]